MSILRDALTTLIAHWTEESTELIPPEEATTVEARLASLKVPIASDIIELYCCTGGMVDGHLDNNAFSLWSLDRIIKESDGSLPGHLEFADCLIDSNRYAVRKLDEGRSGVYMTYYQDRTAPPVPMFNSLAEFMTMYAAARDEHAAFDALNHWI